jgi:hypothetical protein
LDVPVKADRGDSVGIHLTYACPQHLIARPHPGLVGRQRETVKAVLDHQPVGVIHDDMGGVQSEEVFLARVSV